MVPIALAPVTLLAAGGFSVLELFEVRSLDCIPPLSPISPIADIWIPFCSTTVGRSRLPSLRDQLRLDRFFAGSVLRFSQSAIPSPSQQNQLRLVSHPL